jgi:hypothetical protein
MEFPFILYPAFDFIEQRGQFLPSIRLPEDYKDLVPKFYQQGRKPDVEDYAKIIQERFLESKLEVRLNWDNEQGLTNISVGPSGGLDLSEINDKFQEHNLGTKTGIASGFIAMKYISELLKSR